MAEKGNIEALRIFATNSSKGDFSINLALPQAGFYKVKIYDVKGSLVWSNRKNCSSPGIYTERLGNLHADKGVYFLKLEQNNKVATSRFVKVY